MENRLLVVVFITFVVVAARQIYDDTIYCLELDSVCQPTESPFKDDDIELPGVCPVEPEEIDEFGDANNEFV